MLIAEGISCRGCAYYNRPTDECLFNPDNPKPAEAMRDPDEGVCGPEAAFRKDY